MTKLVYVGRENRVGVASGDSHFRVYRTDNGSRETNVKVEGDYLYALDSNRDGSQFIVGGASGAATRIDQSGKQSLEYASGEK
ncbi:vegetatible incompatibility protein HET-E1 [Rhodopirellula europaea SH398]|uniref:Vegetatible incompatibility protein HET-E1 n=1 Tax=Rhodopirellula europaea SH398 TaxID=1263868 RepID=M5RW28_9BACT|nr:vegetatible incompatibility protein HET-E1 [Rhodopirellula europaea SH398]